MKAAANVILGIGLISLVVAIISRITMMPVPVVAGGLEASAILQFANTCFLVTIVLMLGEMVKK